MEVSTAGYVATNYYPQSRNWEDFWRKIRKIEDKFVQKYEEKAAFIIKADEVAEKRPPFGMGYNNNIYIAAYIPIAKNGNRVRFKVVKKVLYNKQRNPHIDGNVLSPIYYKLINKTRHTTKVLEIKNEPYKLTVYDPTIHVPLFTYNKSLKIVEDETWEVIHINPSLMVSEE